MAYTINVTNGTATERIVNGTYAVTAAVTGFNNASILPTSVTVEAGTDTYGFTIAATGALTLHVTEEGTAGGTDVVGATFVRCDSAGTAYGTPITTDANGEATFADVPFAATGAPLIYFRQTASDGSHEFDPALTSTSMVAATQTNEIANPLAAERTINMTDANYANLPIAAGSITLT
jgi:hypothetical protein